MKLLLASALLFSFGAHAGVDYCGRYSKNETSAYLMRSLAEKLSYPYETFCANDRMLDVFQEYRRVYHREDDRWHNYKFVTVHYAEYSCEYRYDLDVKGWNGQYCYSTF